jgi:hypothetical protein
MYTASGKPAPGRVGTRGYSDGMTEYELQSLWSKARMHVIVSQIAPTLLLVLTVWLLASGLGDSDLSVRFAATGILLASGLLGAVAQVSSSNEAIAVAADLRTLGELGPISAVSRRIVAQAPFANIVRFVSPAIFTLIFIALLVALFL